MSDEYRIDDLAREAGTTVRNVRSYQERGLLPAPEKRGRVAIYGAMHLARLRLITRLLQRGLPLQAIGELIQRWLEGNSLDDLLGLEAALVAPWTGDDPDEGADLDAEELFGGPVGDDVIQRARDLGVIEVADDGRILAADHRLLRLAIDLVAEGVPLPAVVDLGVTMRRHLDGIATAMIDTIVDHLIQPIIDKGVDDMTGDDLAEVARIVTRLKPVARMGVDATLRTALDEGIADRVKAVFEELGADLGGDLTARLADPPTA